MQVRIIDSSKDKRWNEFVANHLQGTVFHLSNWAEVMVKTYNYKPYYFVMEDGEGNIRSGWPFFLVDNGIYGNKLISVPFTDCITPIFERYELVSLFLEKIFEIYKKEKINYIEIRGNFPNSDNGRYKTNNYFKYHILNIYPNLETVWRKCKQKSVRYSIKRAEKLGVKVDRSKEKETIRIFYNLNLLTRKKHGVIPQPYSFFENIWQSLISKGYGFVSVAWYDKIPIAASIFLEYKNKIYHKFNASDKGFKHLYPNYLILWDVVQYANNKGIKYLDLGRTAPDNLGLMTFKRHWGAEEVDLPYYYYPEVRGVSSMKHSNLKYKIATSILRKTPTKMLEMLGNKFYRYLA